jgi:hypothetical protein
MRTLRTYVYSINAFCTSASMWRCIPRPVSMRGTLTASTDKRLSQHEKQYCQLHDLQLKNMDDAARSVAAKMSSRFEKQTQQPAQQCETACVNAQLVSKGIQTGALDNVSHTLCSPWCSSLCIIQGRGEKRLHLAGKRSAT